MKIGGIAVWCKLELLALLRLEYCDFIIERASKQYSHLDTLKSSEYK